MDINPSPTILRAGAVADLLEKGGCQLRSSFHPHPERPTGGAHMRRIFFSEELGIVMKGFDRNARDINESLELAKNKLGGLVAPFDVTSEGGVIYQEATTALNYYIRSLTPEDPKIPELANEYYALILQCIRRGVFNWDPKPENFGIDRYGKLVAIDLGGFVSNQDVKAEMDEEGDYQSDDSFIARFHAHCGEVKKEDHEYPSIAKFLACKAPPELTPKTNVQHVVIANQFPSERPEPVVWSFSIEK